MEYSTLNLSFKAFLLALRFLFVPCIEDKENGSVTPSGINAAYTKEKNAFQNDPMQNDRPLGAFSGYEAEEEIHPSCHDLLSGGVLLFEEEHVLNRKDGNSVIPLLPKISGFRSAVLDSARMPDFDGPEKENLQAKDTNKYFSPLAFSFTDTEAEQGRDEKEEVSFGNRKPFSSFRNKPGIHRRKRPTHNG